MTDATNGRNGKHETAKPQRALVPVGINGLGMLQPSNLAEAIEVAKIIAHSGIVPKQFDGNPGAVLVAIQMGAEIGLSPMAALQGIAVINGRPSLWGDAMLAVVRAHRECDDVVEDFDAKAMTATCTVKRRDKSPVTRTFSLEDAKTAGLWGKQGPWCQYPKRMLAMRARAFALRDSFPDALRGVHCAEEARDVVDLTPEWRERQAPADLAEGFRTFGSKKPAEQPTDAEVVDEPAHDAATGEVKQETKPAQDTSYGPPPMDPEPETKKPDAPAAKGQSKLGF